MSKPQRIQRSRAKSWRMPAGAVSVCRPGPYGNPYRVGVLWLPKPLGGVYRVLVPDVRASLRLFAVYALDRLNRDPRWLDSLRGLDLACWCPLDQPCHGDILLELANR